MSQQIIKKLFGICVACQKELNVDREFEKELSSLLPLIKLSDVAADGTLIEWDSDYTQNDLLHRHVSHLWGLFPGDLFGEDETLRRACQKTLEKRGDLGTGWSLGWKVNLYAYLGQGDKAFEILKNQLSIVEPSAPMDMHKGGSYPNMLCAHPPFQIDGNFGATSGIASMFLQSGTDYIKLLPALPKELGKGSVKGLVAKGGIKTEISFSFGKLLSFSLVSPVDCETDLHFEGKVIKAQLKKNQKFIYTEEA
jgi:alpha-L-fucosidase 2